MDGDRDRDPHWSTGLSSQGPNEEQKEGEHEQGSQDHEGCVHPLRQWDWSNGSSPRPAVDWERWSMWSKWTLWTWLAMKADWEAKDNGFWFYCMDWLCGSLVCLDAHLYRPGWRGRTLDFPWGREPWLLLGLEREGMVGRGREKGGREEVEIFNKLIKNKKFA